MRRILRALKAFSAVEFRGEAQASLPLELALAEATMTADPVAATAPEPAPGTSSWRSPAAIAPAAPAPSRVSVESAPARPAPSLGERLGMRAKPPADLPAPPASDGADVASTATTERDGAVPALSLEEARTRFRDIYLACKSAHAGTGGFLNSGCDIVALDGRTITFGFEFGWIPEKFLPGTQAYRLLTGAVEQVLGRRFEVQCIHVPNVENRLRATAPKSSHLADEARKLGLTPVNRGNGA